MNFKHLTALTVLTKRIKETAILNERCDDYTTTRAFRFFPFASVICMYSGFILGNNWNSKNENQKTT